MARKLNEKLAESKSAPKTALEMRNWYEKNKARLEKFDAANNPLTLRDVTKNDIKFVSAFDKESLRSYLQNIGSNEVNLRNLSRYLYYRSHPYYRLIMYNANMFDLNARTVKPNYNMLKPANPKTVIKEYWETISILDEMNLQFEFLKAYATCFREDVFFGCVYHDETGFFILPLDPDYCKISGVYQTGDFSFVMDMSYFKSRQTTLEAWGEPFASMYREYDTGDKQRWQPMPDEYAICLKARAEDWQTVVPPFSGLLSGIINLIDMDDIQAINDEQSIYKMIWLEMETITNTKEVDDWKVDPSIMIEYFNRMINEALPDYVSAAIVPGKLDTIAFDNDKVTDTNKVSKATETLFNTSGGAQILNSATISGTTAFTAAIIADTEMAISMLLPQTENWLNRFLSYKVSNPCKVKFFEVSVYTKEALRKSLLESCQYGLSNIIAYNTLNGISEKTTLAMNSFEVDILGLVDKLKPLPSSYTSSRNDDVGAPTKDSTEITDDGEASREKTDNKN